MGKTVALFFSARGCGDFTLELINVYNELKKSEEAFEIVFISRDENQEAFEDYYKSMPWLALPFGDKTGKDLLLLFHVRHIPSLVVIGPDGKTVTEDAKDAVSIHGAEAYPFTDMLIWKGWTTKWKSWSWRWRWRWKWRRIWETRTTEKTVMLRWMRNASPQTNL